jgi:hypothetical protein
MSNEPFFRRIGEDSYQPTPACRGPWDPKSLHGRVVAGLLAFEIDRKHGDPAFHPARLTVDLYRLPDFSPVTVKTTAVREGGRIRVIDAEYICNGISMGRATCQLLRRTENSEGNIWSPPNWDAPMPEDVPPPDTSRSPMGGMWATRNITNHAGIGGDGPVGQKRMWMSEVRELVDDVPITPWMRAALAADFASPFANSGDKGLGYINTDITLYLHRLPRQEWIGFEVVNHQANEGIAVGECFLYDKEGPIGTSTVTGLAQRRS